MASRTPERQSTHNKKVREEAQKYDNKGYKVYADHLEKWGRPQPRNGYIPDVVAKKAGKEIITEVETEESVKEDQDQIEAFERYAREHANVKFELVIAQ